ncbi:MAG: hypothetical protein II882_02385 [Lachnospiraceae bacterium]|nr:hypothetical protein [Lachnospiraceae bacterium]
MARKHNLTTYAFFKDIRQSFDAISDESAGALIKALFAFDDGETVDLSGKNETVRGMFPEMARQMAKIQMMRAKNAKRFVPNVIPDGVPPGVPEGVPPVVPYGSQTGAPKPKPISLDNTDVLSSRKKKAAKPPRPSSDLFLADFVCEAWEEYSLMCKRDKKTLTEKTALRRVRKLEDLSGGDTVLAEKILLQSAEHHWIDLFPLRTDTGKKAKKEEIDFAKIAYELETEMNA